MRSLLSGMLSVALLLAASSASALPDTDDLVNWTETEIGADFSLMSFQSDPDSVFELSGGFTEPVISIEEIFSGSPVSFAIGTILTVTIPNFFDPLPTKDFWVELRGGNGGAQGAERPVVISLVGSDSPFPSGGGSAPVFGSFVSSSGGCDGGIGCIEEQRWLLEPNPDFETFSVYIPTAYEFLGATIITQSVPEPGSLAMVASGLLGLALAGRRRAA